MKVGSTKRGAAGGMVLMVLQSECCNSKTARGTYTAFCGGVSVMPKITMPIQTATTFLTFNGPDTPSESDPVGLFSYWGLGVPIGSYGRLRTGKFVASPGWAWEAGNDLGFDALLGITVGGGTTTCCDQ